MFERSLEDKKGKEEPCSIGEHFLSLRSVRVLLVFLLSYDPLPQSFSMEENIIRKGKAKIFFTNQLKPKM